MNIFSEIKDILKPSDVVTRYLGSPVKVTNNILWYYSPFRLKERTPSFGVNDKKGIHDFGTSEHFDIISFVARYFNTSNIQAINILKTDFNLMLGNEYETKETIRLLKKQKEEQKALEYAINTWYEGMYSRLTDIYKGWRNTRLALQDKLYSSLSIVYKNEKFYENLVDKFLGVDEAEKIILYQNKKRYEDYAERGII